MKIQHNPMPTRISFLVVTSQKVTIKSLKKEFIYPKYYHFSTQKSLDSVYGIFKTYNTPYL